ncbi:MAG: hypothetical protein EOS11_25250 [Mesorhizobium sp.]|uniref:phospholipase D-like domain-containing protein n=1 Tax=Mesorhizobium sp. TaxID=1871066 RepID=UPI000FE33269|nr:phospholipase D-like domain-containing protein [Mesorhizobium sp.]RWO38190.1 MAG: hypothetical protein EOS11_25250 [Mesorhizobium sp.]TIN78403.1 MAG: hypothetical protein E5Y09_13565 [Mesorhizobium sp.]
MSNLITQSPWGLISAAARQAKKPSHVAVAYLGQSGDRLLPLLKGSRLVVDASLPAVRAGITYPGALQKLQKRGVRIFVAPLLHSKVFAFDQVGFVGSTNASTRSQLYLLEATLSVTDAPTLKDIRNYVSGLCVDELSVHDLAWLASQYKPPVFPLPSISAVCYSRLLIQIVNSDQQGYSGHQVQPPSGAWGSFFQLTMQTPILPTLRLRNVDNGMVIDRQVVRHTLVMTVDIPEAAPGAILEMWEVGKNRYDYRVVVPTAADFGKLDKELHQTTNSLWHSGRLWIVT